MIMSKNKMRFAKWVTFFWADGWPFSEKPEGLELSKVYSAKVRVRINTRPELQNNLALLVPADPEFNSGIGILVLTQPGEKFDMTLFDSHCAMLLSQAALLGFLTPDQVAAGLKRILARTTEDLSPGGFCE